MEPIFFSRDISWLAFNQRVLDEASNNAIPLGERLKFLAIFSSNLDEFYRVRMPVLMAKHFYADKKKSSTQILHNAISEFDEARNIIQKQQEQSGIALRLNLIPLLAQQNVIWIYGKPIPERLRIVAQQYFFSTIAAFIHINYITPKSDFFPENNKLYLFVSFADKDANPAIINIPSDKLQRFFSVDESENQYIIFIDDIIKNNLAHIFNNKKIDCHFSFKVTRDAELNLEDELPGDLAEKIEKQVAKRDLGEATRLLYQTGMPLRQLQLLCNQFKIATSNTIEGGEYHNLKDIMALPLHDKNLFNPKQTAIEINLPSTLMLHDFILAKDIMIHSPYNNYDTVLRFFNEAAIDDNTEEIYVTMYRIAENSRIANALISAAKNGKKIFVFDELKARFDEENNIRWAKKMKAAGVKVIYSIPTLKVHAKIALIKKKNKKNIGLLATGNMNETTAKLYTDHELFTAHAGILNEMENLFLFLNERKIPGKKDILQFDHLLVAQFNLQEKFIALIDREIENAGKGLPASIWIKLNNLEEQTLITKLYEASKAGVKIKMIVRSICCLIPGVKGMSENISVKRIVDKYLEHGRVFSFYNNGNTEVFAGSADWMNRNIYTRIEVCFPVYDKAIKNELISILQLQLNDNMQAVLIDDHLHNIPAIKNNDEKPLNAQNAIYNLLKAKNQQHELA